ncbi:hypothetical protein TVAG_236660 [Trichomonas vaginalis G3]|uniref:Uncharacterized protein n=1 Tax=Trichomonas vaginalis (strain ATCC PRA-98 / G3) TaxID=412133 RepID=A2F7A6_TRIV3|nr:hypothetical protein TVAGG3_0002800 [Trichomonas vaginalis G3]EAX99221.1 hypothetical protein TVAG_236660 [Trichomonas vaginalis G3]KAI5538727.1 hypothetical protein TVAGG3_0002800 [Trichomonas vaginalis G3]|eukprot:XP_001312151.1 hypothetical protein [Trichomonas vaginalis G3]
MIERIASYCIYTNTPDLCDINSHKVEFHSVQDNYLNFSNSVECYVDFADDVPSDDFNIYDHIYFGPQTSSIYFRGLGSMKYISRFKYNAPKFGIQITFDNVKYYFIESIAVPTELFIINSQVLGDSNLVQGYELNFDIFSWKYINSIQSQKLNLFFKGQDIKNLNKNIKITKIYQSFNLFLSDFNYDYDVEYIGHLVVIKSPQNNFSITTRSHTDSLIININSTTNINATFSNKFLSNTIKSSQVSIFAKEKLNFTFLPSFWIPEANVNVQIVTTETADIHNFCKYVPMRLINNALVKINFYSHVKAAKISGIILDKIDFNIFDPDSLVESVEFHNLEVINSSISCNKKNILIHISDLLMDHILNNIWFNGSATFVLSGTIAINHGDVYLTNVLVSDFTNFTIIYSSKKYGQFEADSIKGYSNDNFLATIFVIEETTTLNIAHIYPIVSKNELNVANFDLNFLNPENYLLFKLFSITDKRNMHKIKISNDPISCGNLCLISEGVDPFSCPSTTTEIIRTCNPYSTYIRSIHYMTDKSILNYSSISLMPYTSLSASIESKISFPFDKFENIKVTDINLLINSEKIKFKGAIITNSSIQGPKILEGKKLEIDYKSLKGITCLNVTEIHIKNGDPKTIYFKDNEVNFGSITIPITKESRISWTTENDISTSIVIDGSSFEKFDFSGNQSNFNKIFLDVKKKTNPINFYYHGELTVHNEEIPLFVNAKNVYFMLEKISRLQVPYISSDGTIKLNCVNCQINADKLVIEKTGTAVAPRGFFATDDLHLKTNGLTQEIGTIYPKKNINIDKNALSYVDFQSFSENLTINVNFTLSSVPYILVRDSFPKNISFVMSHIGEGQELKYQNDWNNVQVDVVCGEKINCSNWNASWVSSTWAFNGTDRLFDMKCGKGLYDDNLMCYSIVNRIETPIPQKKSKTKMIIFIVTGVVVGLTLIIALTIFIYNRSIKKKRIMYFITSDTLHTPLTSMDVMD